MTKLTALAFLAAIASIALAQERKKSSDLPTACEVRAYYLDKDGKPADPSDVKAALIFETKDGKSRTYPMTLTQPKDKQAELPPLRHFSVDGTPYKMAVVAIYSDASVPGGHTHYDKPWLQPLPVVVDPDQKRDVEKRDADKHDPVVADAPYFKTYLNEQAISELASVPYTEASIQFTHRNEIHKTKCFTCTGGVPGSACAMISDDLKLLEKQLQANDMAGAKATMSRIKSGVDAIPSTKDTEAARKDASAATRDLDAAVQSGNREKALTEIARLKEKCQKCDECIDPQEKESKPKK